MYIPACLRIATNKYAWMHITDGGNNMIGKKTTVLIRSETRNRMRKHGLKGETYDDIIVRLLDAYEHKGVESAE